jgi:L-rhamnose-H+ transport protein
MTGPVPLGLVFVLAAGILQGVFLLPMDRARGWGWEHTWLAFSFFGMLAFNWLITLATIPEILDIYRLAPSGDIGRLVIFGLGWGLGAVLFGLGMERLGLALGYPIIMGLIASLGALLPLALFFPQTLVSPKGALIVCGTAAVLAGIVLCSRAGARKAASGVERRRGVAPGLIMAVAAGSLSCLPNIGMTFGNRVVDIARAHGVPASRAANVVWALFFTAGFVVNAAYCLYLMVHRRTGRALFGPNVLRNLSLTALMGLLWIGSFYGYGIGAERLGPLGPVVGWPLFIACSICVGNLVGLWRGEWRSAPPMARTLLTRGLVVLLSAVVLIASSGALP